MNRYISDMHLGHANAIRFDHRPFADVEEMEHYMMKKWQDTVQKDDDVWILGDFAYHDKKNPVEYLRQLPGHKHLIIGNHDGALLKNAAAMRYFESVDMLTKIVDTLDGEKKQVILCHYPIYEWDGYHRVVGIQRKMKIQMKHNYLTFHIFLLPGETPLMRVV